ncbi:hypothetical protein D8674_020080 [Pyrus ussuriensis x Pyrus communis]|uniref:Myb/SANT-like domain-containing protein n=1 Tax=Pyrus ussuriensis x Pyrus communis TaxID=2448454 RepID=A0A5N5HK14_9ROSA|nr:hypothetical protein D8674_020080 [Pyrus ussuriensis x Pyrus communis]
MVVGGVRCETRNLKAGTFVMVATKMKEMIPGINIKSKHIQNKLKHLKEKYSSAYDMMNTIGFGWDDEKKCVLMDSDDKHPNASCKPNKLFLLYPHLFTVFERDQATGSMAESAVDAIENMRLENKDCDETSKMPPPSPTPSPSVGTSSASQPTRKRKRNKNDADANIVAVIREGWDKAIIEMKNLGESFTFGDAKARLPSELQAMVIDTDLMRIWCTLDDSHKTNFIKMFMDGL